MNAISKPQAVASYTWIYQAKNGENFAFEEALVKHYAMRQKKGDPWSWQTWTPASGDQIHREYQLRYSRFSWDELDSYTTWHKDNDIVSDFRRNVNRYSSGISRIYRDILIEHSHWPKDLAKPAAMGEYKFFLKPGERNRMLESIAKLSKALKDSGWPYSWSWSSAINGKPAVVLEVPHASLAAALTLPRTSISEHLAKSIGEAEAGKLLEAFHGSCAESTHEIYLHRPDLSMSQK